MAFAANGYNLTSTSGANFNAVANAVDGALTCKWGGTTGGSANAYTLTPSPAWTSTTRAEIRYVLLTPHASNTGASTLNVSTIGNAAITYKGQALVGGELVQNVEALLVWDGTSYDLVNHGGGWATWTPSYGTNNGAHWTTVTTNRASYQRHGNRVDFMINASGTTITTDPTQLQFSLPVTASGGFVGGGASISNGTVYAGHWGLSTTTVAYVSRYDTGLLGLGASRSINLQGSYPV
jgi:hypothetical protein